MFSVIMMFVPGSSLVSAQDYNDKDYEKKKNMMTIDMKIIEIVIVKN